MTWLWWLWTAGAYLVGTLPSTSLVARAARRRSALAKAARESGETDGHVLLARHVGAGWAVAAGVADVAKGGVYLILARAHGDLPPAWLAVAGLAAVAGHCWPPYARRTAGRGLAAAAGAFLALLPVPMTVAGAVILVSMLLRQSGLGSTLGLLSVPATAALQGQPPAYLAMAGGIVGLIFLRRLEGVRDLRRPGAPLGPSVAYRLLLDASAPPGTATRSEEEPPPSAEAG